MKNCEEIIRLLTALLTPTIAVVGVWIGLASHCLLKRKRKDELFDRRFRFYKDFEKLWKSTGEELLGKAHISLEWDDLAPWVQEAYFLFGKDIANHIKSYEGKSYNSPLTWVPDSDFAKPFHQYLKF